MKIVKIDSEIIACILEGVELNYPQYVKYLGEKYQQLGPHPTKNKVYYRILSRTPVPLN